MTFKTQAYYNQVTSNNSNTLLAVSHLNIHRTAIRFSLKNSSASSN